MGSCLEEEHFSILGNCKDRDVGASPVFSKMSKEAMEVGYSNLVGL